MSWVPLQNITLASTDTEVIFANIPNSFRDLYIVINGELSTTNTPDVTMKLNSDASNYSQIYMRGNGNTTASGTYSVIYLNSASTWSSGRRYSHIVNVMDYSATDRHKTVLARGNWSGGDINATASRWASTAVVTSVGFSVNSGSFAVGTTFALFGISG